MEFTKYEKARMVGSRALQIAMGSPLLLDFSEEELEALKYNPIEIAKREFAEGVIPMEVRRTMPEPKGF
ncbi:MAG: DNA-directed RNA polymerase subunit K [Candidatus Woesearchaeota archaeon]